MMSNILIWNKEIGFIRINEGDGSNLLPEDEEQGFVDYIMVDSMKFDGMDLVEIDDAWQDFSIQAMLEEAYQEKFKTVEEVVQYLIECEFIPDVEYMVLEAI